MWEEIPGIEKFDRSGTYSSTVTSASQMLITDDKIPELAEAALKEEKITVIKVS